MLLQPVETVCWAKGKSVTLIVLSYCPSVHFFFLLVTADDHRNTISDLAVLVSVVKNSSGGKQDSL